MPHEFLKYSTYFLQFVWIWMQKTFTCYNWLINVLHHFPSVEFSLHIIFSLLYICKINKINLSCRVFHRLVFAVFIKCCFVLCVFFIEIIESRWGQSDSGSVLWLVFWWWCCGPLGGGLWDLTVSIFMLLVAVNTH